MMSRFGIYRSILGLIVLAAFGCNHPGDTAKDVINKTGETVGEGATEFVRGVSKGVDKTLECKVELSKELQVAGLSTGQFKVMRSDTGENILTLYLVFNKDLSDTLHAKLFDEHGQEYGRSKVIVQGKKDDARFYDFVFDKRTDIESKSTFRIE